MTQDREGDPEIGMVGVLDGDNGKLKWERGTEVCIGAEGMGDSPVLGLPPSRAEFCYDFAHPAVTEYKLALAR